MKTIRILVLGLAALLYGNLAAAGEDDYAATVKIFRESAVSQAYFNNAYGYAVFPRIGKGGLIIGGAYGEGQVYQNGQLAGRCSVTQLSIGFQLGGQAYSEIIFFQDKRAYDEFTSGSFEFDASASAVAVTASAQAQYGTTGTSAGTSVGPTTGQQLAAKYVKGMAVFVQIRGGFMFETAVGGQKFKYFPL